MLRKTLVVLAVLLFTASQASADWFKKTEKGSGNLKTVSFDLEEFTRIRSTCSADINIKVGEARSVELTCDDNIIDNIMIKVRGSRLIIDTDGSFSVRRGPRIDITVPSLESVEVSGSGDVDIRGLDSEEFSYKISGSGDLVVAGKVDYLDLRVSGSGDIDASDLIAKDVNCRISGSGDIKVYASESFDGSVSGSGDITYYGDPKYVDRSVSGSGSIKRR